MKFLERRHRLQVADAGPSDEHQLPIPGYDQLKDKQISDQLSQLSQVELATVETYERAHASRPAVLEKLRYMRSSEPLPGYDDLTPEQIADSARRRRRRNGQGRTRLRAQVRASPVGAG